MLDSTDCLLIKANNNNWCCARCSYFVAGLPFVLGRAVCCLLYDTVHLHDSLYIAV